MEKPSSIYFQPEILKQMKTHYKQAGGMIYLPDFLGEKMYGTILEELEKSKGKKEKIADRFSYEVLKHEELKRIFSSPQSLEMLGGVMGTKIKNVEIAIRRYGHRDYSLIHDSEGKCKRVEFTFLLMRKWNTAWGGHKVYICEGEEPRLVPLAGNGLLLIDTENSVNCTPLCPEFSVQRIPGKRGPTKGILCKHKQMNSFVQYVNHYAGKEKLVMVEGFIH